MFWFGTCTSRARLDGKTAVITGCNTGIGKETALDFLQRGARVIMACRDLRKAEEAARDIVKQAQQHSTEDVGVVVVVKLDLSSLSSVRECARHLLDTEPRIHILVNNAGIFACPKAVTEDGYEMQFAVNHLGHFLLTLLLLPRITSSAPARIVTVSSVFYCFGSINFEDLNFEKSYSAFYAYCQSKLANILFTKELAERLEGTGVTTYCLHPGMVRTEGGRHMDSTYFPGMQWLFLNVSHLFTKSPKQGAQTTIFCSVDDSVARESGFYYRDCQRSTPFYKARDSETAKKLWNESLKLVGLEDSNTLF